MYGNSKFMSDYKMSKREVGRLGGLARQAKHGNLGTPEGRRLGGLRSQSTHKKNNTGFIILRNVDLPKYSVQLAETFGILAGDGHIGLYQVSVTTNSETDIKHAQYVQKLFENLFHVPVHMAKRKDSKAVVVVMSSKQIADFCVKHGLTRGNKVRAQLDVPPWIQKNKKFSTAFVRGLFDTDGSVYVDVHNIRGKEYRNIGIAFTNRSVPLLSFFKRTLELYGFHPTQKTKYIVFLRREAEVFRYFDVLGSSNSKHLDKLHAYQQEKGRVPKRS